MGLCRTCIGGIVHTVYYCTALYFTENQRTLQQGGALYRCTAVQYGTVQYGTVQYIYLSYQEKGLSIMDMGGDVQYSTST